MKLYTIGIYMKKKTIFKTIVNLSAYSYVYLFVPAYLWRADLTRLSANDIRSDLRYFLRQSSTLFWVNFWTRIKHKSKQLMFSGNAQAPHIDTGVKTM